MSFANLIIALKGSTTSGNWGHAGRPGKKGGSAPGGGYGGAPRGERLGLAQALRQQRQDAKRKQPAAIEQIDTKAVIVKLRSKLKDKLVIRDEGTPAVQDHLRDLNLLPDTLLSKMGSKVSINLGNVPMTELDSNQAMKGKAPRGWPPGYTWDSVGGAYNSAANSVTVGNGKAKSAGISVALHEYGHGVQAKIMTAQQFKKLNTIHNNIYDKLPAYLQQGVRGGGAGASELWAEGFATVLKDRPTAVKNYGQDFVSLVDEIIS